jgi:ATP dependent DNA ligase domain
MRYNTFHYIEPPRTQIKGIPSMLPALEEQGFWAQYKRNGSNSLIVVYPDRTVECWNRHHERRQRWKFSDPNIAIFAGLPGKKFWLFNGELMDQQTAHIKDIHYLYDLLVADGESLFGTTYRERYQRLCDIWDFHIETPGHYVLDDYTWLARTYTTNLLQLYQSLDQREDEGLMVKRPDGLWVGSKADSWMVKIRQPGY